MGLETILYEYVPFIRPEVAKDLRSGNLEMSKLQLKFGHFQDFVRINKSLLSTKAERDLGLWPKGAGENASRRDSGIVAWHEVPGKAPPKRAVP